NHASRWRSDAEEDSGTHEVDRARGVRGDARVAEDGGNGLSACRAACGTFSASATARASGASFSQRRQARKGAAKWRSDLRGTTPGRRDQTSILLRLRQVVPSGP